MPTKKYNKRSNKRKYKRRNKVTNKRRYKRFFFGGQHTIDEVKSKIDELRPSKPLSDEEFAALLQVINGKSASNSMSSMFKEGFSSLASGITNSVTGIANSAINSTLPIPDKTKLEIRYEPKHSTLYSKQGSNASDNYENGDIVVIVRNEGGNIIKQIDSVDSTLAKILNKCNDLSCLSNNNTPLIAKQELDITKDKI